MDAETTKRKTIWHDYEQWTEPHEHSTSYVDADGCLTVALDCGKHFTKAPWRAVLSGEFFTGCDLNHRERSDNFDWPARQERIRTEAQLSLKTGGQS